MRVHPGLTAALLVAALGLSSCGSGTGSAPPRFKSYSGPEVTRIAVLKSERRMYLMHGETVLKGYDIDLGFAPEGQKQFEGDGKTPEGSYIIDRRNPNSAYHLSLGISYPTPAQIAAAREVGRKAGGDIFIHGGPTPRDKGGKDWTFGCISITDSEIEDVYAMVRDGTRIDIYP